MSAFSVKSAAALAAVALCETDPGKIRARIFEAQFAVLKRSTELVGQPARNHSIGVDQNMTPACQTSKVGEIGGTFLVVYSRVVAQWRTIEGEPLPSG